MIKKLGTLFIFWMLSGVSYLYAEVTLDAIHSASNDVLVAFITGDSTDVKEVNIEDKSLWKINGKPVSEIFIYATAADPCDYHVYIKTSGLVEGAQYRVETPYGDRTISFKEREIFCEAIKTNQSGYSALSRTRYANFAIWLGTGGAQKIEGVLPSYEVFETETNRTIASGTLTEIGEDEGSGDYVYRIDLASVPEGGPYKIAVKGYGSSHPLE